MKAFAQFLDVTFVEGALLVQDLGDDAFGAKDGNEIFLAETIGLHQRAEDFDRRSIGNGMVLFLVGFD